MENNPAAQRKEGKREKETANRHVYVEPGVQIDLVQDLKDKYDASQKDSTSHSNKILFWTKISALLLFIYAGLTFWQGYLTRNMSITAQQQLVQSARPWVGLDSEPSLGLQTAAFGFNGKVASVMYQMQIKNFSNYVAKSVDPNIVLVIIGNKTADLVPKATKGQCARYDRNPNIGGILFPGPAKLMKQGPTFPDPTFITEEATGLEAWVIGCVGYRDQFGNNHHTAFAYWLVDPKTHEPLTFDRPEHGYITQGVFEQNNSAGLAFAD